MMKLLVNYNDNGEAGLANNIDIQRYFTLIAVRFVLVLSICSKQGTVTVLVLFCFTLINTKHEWNPVQ